VRTRDGTELGPGGLLALLQCAFGFFGLLAGCYAILLTDLVRVLGMSYRFSARGSRPTSQPPGVVTASVASYTPPLTRCSSAPERSRALISLKLPTGRWSIKT
jgi:hypothetical protein